MLSKRASAVVPATRARSVCLEGVCGGEAPLRLRALLQRGAQTSHGLAPPLLVAKPLQWPHALHIPVCKEINVPHEAASFPMEVMCCEGQMGKAV